MWLQGGLFEYVSGANFLGEIIEWLGFALASDSLPGWAFAFYVVCNIGRCVVNCKTADVFTRLSAGPRALHHHKWYQQQFGKSYPAGRKALVPFVL
jgi:steroid 5-alpha reductase family enzyme